MLKAPKLKVVNEVKVEQMMKKKVLLFVQAIVFIVVVFSLGKTFSDQQWFGGDEDVAFAERLWDEMLKVDLVGPCLLYTSPSPRDQRGSRMPSSA